MTPTALVIPAAALLSIAVARAEEPPTTQAAEPTAIFVPAALDLGEWAAGGDASASVWLINAGARPVELVGTEVDGDGLALAPIARGPVPPSGVVEFRVSITADEREGATRTRRVTAFLANRRPVTLDVTVRSIHPDVHLPPPDADRHAWSPVRPAPARLDFGPAAPGERTTRSIWLVNTADSPARLVAAKGGCGCVEFPGFEPVTITPGRAVELRPVMTAQGDIGSDRFKYATFVFDDLEPVPVEFCVRVVDPRESRVRRFVAARDRADTAAMRVCMTLDSRIWLVRHEGEGIARRADGTAPWSDWDAFMNTRRRYDDFEVGERGVCVRVTETSDFHRLLGCPPHTLRHTYLLDGDRLITGLLVEGLLVTPEPGEALPPEACIGRFVAWARGRDPRMLDALLADGRVVRTGTGAARWRDALVTWRDAAGLPAVDPGEPGE